MAKKAKSVKAAKAVAKKPAVAPKKKDTKKEAPQKLGAVKKPYSKTQLFQYLAENTELTKRKIADIFGLLENVIDAHLCKNSAGIFNLVGLVKFQTKHKPAVKARKGRNPFTGEETMLKAKPARTVVKIKPLKKLKDKVA